MDNASLERETSTPRPSVKPKIRNVNGHAGKAEGIEMVPTDAARFLAALDPTARAFTFQSFDDIKDRKDTSLARVIHASLADARSELEALQQAGAGVFVTINETDLKGRKTANVTRIRAVFVDLDGSPLQPVLDAKPAPQIIIESSPGRWHAYWLVSDCPLDQFSIIQRALIKRFDSDKSVHDLPRVMRVPGFIHQKEAPFLSRVERITRAKPYAVADVVSGLGLDIEGERKDTAPTGADDDPPEALEESEPNFDLVASALNACDEAHGFDDRDKWLHVLMALHSLGWDQGYELALQWSKDIAGGFTSEADVRQAWDSFDASGRINIGKLFALAGDAGWMGRNEFARARLRAALRQSKPDLGKWPDGHIGAMLKEAPPPISWFVDERLLAGRAHVLTGIGGSSKTRMLYHLAVGAVLGSLPWGWAITGTGSAALFLTEDTAEEVHRTVWHLARHTQVAGAARKLIDKLRVFPLAGLRAVMLSMGAGDTPTETDVYEWVLQKIAAMPQPVAFVGIDPAIGISDGDEASPVHQRRLGELMDRLAIATGACVVLVTHAAKTVQGLDEVASHTSRGSGAITDAVRAEYALRTMTAQEARSFGITDLAERKRLLSLRCTKGNSVPPEAGVPIWLRRGDFGMLEPAELQSTSTTSSTGLAPLDKRALDALELMGGLVQPGQPVKFKRWLDACVAAGVVAKNAEPDAQRQTLTRARKQLEAHGRVRAGDGHGEWLLVAGADED